VEKCEQHGSIVNVDVEWNGKVLANTTVGYRLRSILYEYARTMGLAHDRSVIDDGCSSSDMAVRLPHERAPALKQSLHRPRALKRPQTSRRGKRAEAADNGRVGLPIKLDRC